MLFFCLLLLQFFLLFPESYSILSNPPPLVSSLFSCPHLLFSSTFSILLHPLPPPLCFFTSNLFYHFLPPFHFLLSLFFSYFYLFPSSLFCLISFFHLVLFHVVSYAPCVLFSYFGSTQLIALTYLCFACYLSSQFFTFLLAL